MIEVAVSFFFNAGPWPGRRRCPGSMLVALIALPLHAWTADADSNVWQQIPFLNCTSSVLSLNRKLNDESAPPAERHFALTSLLAMHVPAGATSASLTNVFGVPPRWLATAEVSAGKGRMGGPNCHLSFTNAIGEWKSTLRSKPNIWQKPYIWLWLSRNPGSREGVGDFFAGRSAGELDRFLIFTWFRDYWTVFTRTPDNDVLRLHSPQRRTRLSRPPKLAGEKQYAVVKVDEEHNAAADGTGRDDGKNVYVVPVCAGLTLDVSVYRFRVPPDSPDPGATTIMLRVTDRENRRVRGYRRLLVSEERWYVLSSKTLSAFQGSPPFSGLADGDEMELFVINTPDPRRTKEYFQLPSKSIPAMWWTRILVRQ